VPRTAVSCGENHLQGTKLGPAGADDEFMDDIAAHGHGRLTLDEVRSRLAAGAHLQLVELRALDLRGLALRRASLQGSTLDGCRLDGMDLSEADLCDVTLRGCSFVGARLRGARLQRALIMGCDFRADGLAASRIRRGLRLQRRAAERGGFGRSSLAGDGTGSRATARAARGSVVRGRPWGRSRRFRLCFRASRA
jgi:Pentapeptide repeats (8 copies)